MTDRLTPEREAEIRGWLAVMGERKDIRYYGCHRDMTDLLAELDALRADNARLQRKVAGLKAEQDRDDAEYAQAIAERDRALKTTAAMEGEHYAAVHHDYRQGRDMPCPQTAEEAS